MASFLRISIKGVEKVLKNLEKERENQMRSMEKAHTKVASQAVQQLRRGLAHNGGRRPGKIKTSPKGSMPYKHSGQLQDSIGFKVLRTGKKIMSEVGSAGTGKGFKTATRDAEYAKYLEGRNHDGIRPFLWAVQELYTPERIIAYFHNYYKPIQGGK